jgi:formylglycine-generating enzyme required for sulfatase activity
VSFAEASRLCTSRSERLCTENEWEAACRGKNGSSYPYGMGFDPNRCNTESHGGDIAPAGSFARCVSASGAYDMSGNVAEWVIDRGQPAQKGGSAETGPPLVRCSNTVRGVDPLGGRLVGFRCCSEAHGKQ